MIASFPTSSEVRRNVPILTGQLLSDEFLHFYNLLQYI